MQRQSLDGHGLLVGLPVVSVGRHDLQNGAGLGHFLVKLGEEGLGDSHGRLFVGEESIVYVRVDYDVLNRNARFSAVLRLGFFAAAATRNHAHRDFLVLSM